MCRQHATRAAAILVIFCSFCGVSSAQTDTSGETQSPAPSATPAPAPAQKASAAQTLNFQTIAENIYISGLPNAEGYKELLAEKPFTRVVCLIPEGEEIAGAADVAKEAGLKFEQVPFSLDLPVDMVKIDRAAVDAVFAAIEPAKEPTLVCDRYGRHEVGVIDFLYQLRFAKLPFAEALRGAMERGFQAFDCPGVLVQFKLIASGLDQLPVVTGIPISDRDLGEPGEMVSVGGQRLNVKKYGSGPPVYVIHGGPGETHKPMRPYLDDLQKTNTVVYYDQRGCGQSTKPQFVEAYTIDRLTKELDGLREALGHDRISLISHSCGSGLAFDYALSHRDRVDKLVIVSGWARAEDVSPYTALIGRLFSGERRETLIGLMRQLQRERRTYNDREMAQLLRIAYPFNFFGVMSRDFVRDWNRRSEVSAFANMALSPQLFRTYDVKDRLAELNGLPVLVISGEYDIIVPPSAGKVIADSIESAHQEIIPLSGHYPFVEKHDEVIKLITDFLQGGAATSGQ